MELLLKNNIKKSKKKLDKLKYVL